MSKNPEYTMHNFLCELEESLGWRIGSIDNIQNYDTGEILPRKYANQIVIKGFVTTKRELRRKEENKEEK